MILISAIGYLQDGHGNRTGYKTFKGKYWSYDNMGYSGVFLLNMR
jgi:hypothetical protein